MKIRFLLSVLMSLSVLCPQLCAAQEVDGVDSQPVFRGGDIDTFNDWVLKKMFFSSDEPVDLGEQGVVTVRFTVDKKGKIKDLSLVSAYDKKLANKVIATIKKAPAWTPAMKNGEPIDTEMTADIELMYDLLASSFRPEREPLPDSLKSSDMSPDSHAPYFKVKNDQDEFRNWVASELKKANSKIKYGKIELAFVVNKGGYIEDAFVLESSSPVISRDVMRVIYDCPKWCSAGYHKGQYVNVKYSIPIVFSIL